MQIEAGQTACPACGANALEFSSVLHHMICAYVGPAYDFIPATIGCLCPKCRRSIGPNDSACEIVAQSARCGSCGREMPVWPEAPAPSCNAA